MRILLWPLSLIYGVLVRLRNLLFDLGLLKSDTVPVATIVIGNLAVGGSGKSPMTSHLARLLREEFRVAILSRGYGRISRGYRKVSSSDSVRMVGDEPLQYAVELEGVRVAVCEKRVEGVRQLLKEASPPEVVLLDDAFQHRALKPGFSILLTEYNGLFTCDHLLPYGRLREPAEGARRANLIMVTKCPAETGKEEKLRIADKIREYSDAPVLFSYIHYRDKMKGLFEGEISLESLPAMHVYLFCGIARPAPLCEFVGANSLSMTERVFPDHHRFSAGDVTNIRNEFARFSSAKEQRTVLITTRKDAMRLLLPELKPLLKDLPVFILDIEIAFSGDDAKRFYELVLDFIHTTGKKEGT